MVSEINKVKRQQNNKIIKEIHDSFDNCSGEFLNYVNNTIKKKSIKKEPNLIYEMGFLYEQTDDGEILREFNPAKSNDKLEFYDQRKFDIINKYKQKYPYYKFITEEDVTLLCDKYNLICGSSDLYLGEIPIKNLLEIKEFDKHKSKITEARSIEVRGKLIDQCYCNRKYLHTANCARFSPYYEKISKIMYHICAPQKDMDLRGMTIINNRAEVTTPAPDPIVLFPVKEGYFIISKWGIESEDTLTINELMN